MIAMAKQARVRSVARVYYVQVVPNYTGDPNGPPPNFEAKKATRTLARSPKLAAEVAYALNTSGPLANTGACWVLVVEIDPATLVPSHEMHVYYYAGSS